MAQRKSEEGKRDKINFDFTRKELEYILENANFTIEQEEIFKMLTSRYGRASIVNISIKMNISEMASNQQDKNMLMKIAQKEKENMSYIKSLVEK